MKKMSKYTLELRELFEPIKFNPPLYTREEIENWFKDYELSDYLTSKQIQSINTWGLWSKDKLARKIIDHYYMRELGFETPALFKHYVKVTMQEIMEEYLPLIYSSSIEYDPLVNVDYTETFERTADNTGNVNNTGSSTGSSNSSTTDNSSGLSVSSDTPQGQINKQSILNGQYASATAANENETNVESDTTTTTNNSSNTSSTNNTSEEYTKRIKGNSGVSATAQKMVEQYRENIIAIDKEIINKLQDLFMGLY